MTPYTLTYSFAGWQALNPSKPLPAANVDVQFSDVSASITSIIQAVNQIRRSDGKLENGTVTFDSLDPQLVALFGGTNDILVPDINPAAFAAQVEAETGVSNDKIMTPLRTAQAIDAQRPLASQGQAESGTDTSDTVMTPRRVRDSINARRPIASTIQAQNGVNNTSVMTPLRTAEALAGLRTANSAVVELTFGSIGADSSSVQSVSVPGAEPGDGVIVGLPAAGVPAGLVPVAWVSAAGTVTLRMTNVTSGALTPPAADYRLTAIRF